MHHTSSGSLLKLPEEVKNLPQKNFQLLKTNPWHLSLQFKKIGNFWSVRAELNYRALAVLLKMTKISYESGFVHIMSMIILLNAWANKSLQRTGTKSRASRRA